MPQWQLKPRKNGKHRPGLRALQSQLMPRVRPPACSISFSRWHVRHLQFYHRFDEWKREFQCHAGEPIPTAARSEFRGRSFGRDHTQGLNYGKASAKAEVADNDYADRPDSSKPQHSPIWKHSAVFILETTRRMRPGPCGWTPLRRFVRQPLYQERRDEQQVLQHQQFPTRWNC